MSNRLDEKVATFISEKQQQTNQWGETELQRWTEKQNTLKDQVTAFLTEEIARQRARDTLQAEVQGRRDLHLASEIEQMEKKHIQKQLRDTKLACEQEKRVDKRMLTVNKPVVHCLLCVLFCCVIVA